MGPSIAAGSQGWRPNCADLPVVARTKPSRGRVKSISLLKIKICSRSQVLVEEASHAMLMAIPISPTRL